ncbi:MAG TPA: NUDIX domain-containing protein [Candidatus Saccharimonadales bacterium]|nr:NUDIX domain-containing protein [Candidatus Saccharimonadales bacterium]
MKQAAGILLYKHEAGKVKVLLVHPAGPLWAHKDKWLLTKGEVDDADEGHLEAAKREFEEETGSPPPEGEYIDLGEAKGGSKLNHIWALEGDLDTNTFHCNTFTMEWPPKSGNIQEYPECDRAEWFDLPTAKQKLFKTQNVFIDRLAEHLGLGPVESPQTSLL